MKSRCRVELFEHVGLGLIIDWASGVRFVNQTGGCSCLLSEMEGIFVPLRNEVTEKELALVSPENELFTYFSGPKWHGAGATSGIDHADATFIDSVIARAKLAPAISVDRSRLSESHEAWIYVVISGELSTAPAYFGFSPYPRVGVLTWQNSD